jgi:hypothetical protein
MATAAIAARLTGPPSKAVTDGSSFEGGRGWGLNALSAIGIAPARVEEKIYFAEVWRKIRHTMH